MGAFPVMDPRAANMRKQKLASRIMSKAMGSRMMVPGSRVAGGDGRAFRMGGSHPNMAHIFSTLADSTNPRAVGGLGGAMHRPGVGEYSDSPGVGIGAVGAPNPFGNSSVPAVPPVGFNNGPTPPPFSAGSTGIPGYGDSTSAVDPSTGLNSINEGALPSLVGGGQTRTFGDGTTQPATAPGPAPNIPGMVTANDGTMLGPDAVANMIPLGDGSYYDPSTGTVVGTPHTAPIGAMARGGPYSV